MVGFSPFNPRLCVYFGRRNVSSELHLEGYSKNTFNLIQMKAIKNVSQGIESFFKLLFFVVGLAVAEDLTFSILRY